MLELENMLRVLMNQLSAPVQLGGVEWWFGDSGGGSISPRQEAGVDGQNPAPGMDEVL